MQGNRNTWSEQWSTQLRRGRSNLKEEHIRDRRKTEVWARVTKVIDLLLGQVILRVSRHAYTHFSFVLRDTHNQINDDTKVVRKAGWYVQNLLLTLASMVAIPNRD